jgi:hypothetical protein
MLNGFQHAWICSQCLNETSIITGKDIDSIEKKLENKKTDCCNAKYEYIGIRPIIKNITTSEVIKADPNYQPPVEEIEEVIKQVIEQPEVKEEENIEEVKKEIIKETQEEIKKEVVEVKVEEVKVKVEEVKEVKEVSNSLDINELVPPGPKGVSNAQMIPAMKEAIKENSKEKLAFIKSIYPEVFQNSIKYIGKKMQEQLKDLGI